MDFEAEQKATFAQLAAKDDEIMKLQGELQQKQADNIDLTEKTKELEKTIEELEEKMANMHEKDSSSSSDSPRAKSEDGDGEDW